MADRWGRCEAQIFWKNYNFYEAEASARDVPLIRINMDESSVPLVPPALRGVVMRRWRSRRFARPGRFRAGRHLTRMNLTYVAFVSDDAELNRHLPQVVLGRKGILLQRDFRELFELAPDTVYLSRTDTGWATGPTIREIFELLIAVLQQQRPDHAYVLVMDCAPSHLEIETIVQLRAAGIHVLLVPAKLTWLLQPLDVTCFRYFKLCLRRRFYDRFSEQPAAICMRWFLPILYEVIVETIQQKPWPDIFRNVGLRALQSGVSSYIRAHLELDEIPPMPALPPTQLECDVICPRRRSLPAAAFGPLAKAAPLAPLPAPAPLLALPPPPPPPEIMVPVGPLEHPYFTRRQRRRLDHLSAASESSTLPPLPDSAQAVPPKWPALPPTSSTTSPRTPPPTALPLPTARTPAASRRPAPSRF